MIPDFLSSFSECSSAGVAGASDWDFRQAREANFPGGSRERKRARNVANSSARGDSSRGRRFAWTRRDALETSGSRRRGGKRGRHEGTLVNAGPESENQIKHRLEPPVPGVESVPRGPRASSNAYKPARERCYYDKYYLWDVPALPPIASSSLR